MISASSIRIAGLGRYLPKRVVTNEELADRLGVSTDWIVSRSGVQERHWADPQVETNSVMGAAASREALEDAGMSLGDIDLIINASGTPEQAIPDGGALLQRELGLGDSGVMAMTVHTTCLSFLTAMKVAAAFLESGVYRNILVCSSDIASVGLDFDKAEVASLFGDCAAAAVFTHSLASEGSRIERMVFHTYGDGSELTYIAGGGTRLHPNRADRGMDECLFHMSTIPTLRMCKKVIPPMLNTLLKGFSWDGEKQIKAVVLHQSSRAGLETMENMGIPGHRMVRTLEKLGNCIAASIPSTLYEGVKTGRVQRGDRVLMHGTGAGLSVGGAVLVY